MQQRTVKLPEPEQTQKSPQLPVKKKTLSTSVFKTTDFNPFRQYNNQREVCSFYEKFDFQRLLAI